MNERNHQKYYVERAKTARELARNAADPSIAAIHAKFAATYDEMATQPRKDGDSDLKIVQAT